MIYFTEFNCWLVLMVDNKICEKLNHMAWKLNLVVGLMIYLKPVCISGWFSFALIIGAKF